MKNSSALKQENKNLRSLVQTSLLLNSPMPLEKLLCVIMKAAKKVMQAEAATLMLVDDKKGDLFCEVALGEKGKQVKQQIRLKMGEGIAGWVAQNEKPVMVREASLDKRFLARLDQKTGFKTKSILCVPLMSEGRVLGVLEAFNPVAREFFNEEDLKLLEAFSAQAAVAVAKACWHEDKLNQQLEEQNLETAREIQQTFLAKERIQLPKFNFYAKYQPAKAIGGDFYECFILDPQKIVILFGDVSGKGVPASLYMVKTVTEFRHIAARHFPDIGHMMSRLNQTLSRNSTLGMFVTAVAFAFDLEKKKAYLANAGHLPLIYYSGREKKVSFIDNIHCCPPLGILDCSEYASFEYDLWPQDKFLIYTDGLTEERNPKGKEFGLNQLKKTFSQALQKKQEDQVLPFIFDAVNTFGAGGNRDDKTSVMVSLQ